MAGLSKNKDQPVQLNWAALTLPTSGASILNQRVKKRTGFGLVLNETKSHKVFFRETKPKANHSIFSISKLNQNQTSFFLLSFLKLNQM